MSRFLLLLSIIVSVNTFGKTLTVADNVKAISKYKIGIIVRNDTIKITEDSGITAVQCIDDDEGRYAFHFVSFQSLYIAGKAFENMGLTDIETKPFEWDNTLTYTQVSIKDYDYPYENYWLIVRGLQVTYVMKPIRKF